MDNTDNEGEPMERLFLDTTATVYTAINNNNQILSAKTILISLGVNSRNQPVSRQMDTYYRREVMPFGTKSGTKEIGHREHGGSLVTGINDQGWVAFHGEIWRNGLSKNGFSPSRLCELERDGLPKLRLPALPPTAWENGFYPSGFQGEETFVYAMNRSGVAAGWSKMCYAAQPRPCVWRNGEACALSDPTLENKEAVTGNTKTIQGEARGINSHGAVVGWFGGYGQGCAFLWQNNKYHVLDGARLPSVPNWLSGKSYETEAIAINDKGDIAGRIFEHLVRWQNGRLVYLRSLKKERRTTGTVWAINREGIIVGNEIQGGKVKAAFWHGHECVDLSTLLSEKERAATKLICALGINDKGQVVGAAEYAGKRCGFALNIY